MKELLKQEPFLETEISKGWIVDVKNFSNEYSRSAVKKYLIGICLVIALIILSVFWGFHLRSEELFRQQLINNGRAFFEEIVVTRLWLASHQGVYVRQQPGDEVNPYLKAIPGLKTTIRDTTGETYILKNPALVTREISMIAAERDIFKFHITSLNPLNPGNAPDDFERRALQSFASGVREQYAFEATDHGQVFRYMAPLSTEASCLRCHAHQGYQVGDVRGGISVSIPTGDVISRMQTNRTYLAAAVTGVIITIILFVYFVARYFIKDLSLAEHKLYSMATTDALTGAYNRREGFRRIEVEVQRALRNHMPLCAIMLDIDHFKMVNDTHGHQAGDDVLKWVSAKIQNALRASDILCRYGGEEFLILAAETDIEKSKFLAERIRRLIEEESVNVDEQVQIHVTVSLGVVQYQEQETHEFMIFRADKALYQAKHNGRNRVCVG